MKKFKVLVADAVEKETLVILKKSAQVDYRPEITADELLASIADYHALVVRSRTEVTAEVIKKAKNLQVIGRPGVGVDNVDVVQASRQGIAVINTPTATTRSVAEYTLGLFITLPRNFFPACSSLKSGQWEKKKFKGREILGKTLGVVGLGHIGQEVARLAKLLGMKVMAFSPTIAKKDPKKARRLGVKLVSLSKLFELADFISIHKRLTEKTRGLIGKKELTHVKQGAYLIDVSRGGILDHKALLWAVESGKIAGAAVDVYPQEPPLKSPLLENDKILTLPHLGGQTLEGQKRAGVEISKKVTAFLKGKKVDSIVNREALKRN